jgi:hypothetical protein
MIPFQNNNTKLNTPPETKPNTEMIIPKIKLCRNILYKTVTLKLNTIVCDSSISILTLFVKQYAIKIPVIVDNMQKNKLNLIVELYIRKIHKRTVSIYDKYSSLCF